MPQDKLKRLEKDGKEARLLVACWQGREDEVKKILNSGKPMPRIDNAQSIKEEHEYRARGKASRSATKISEIKFPKADLYRYGTPLHKACQRGDVPIVETLIENISNTSQYKACQLLDEKTEVGNTPLHCAAHCGHVAVCEVLLEALADLTVQVNGKSMQKLENGDLTYNASLASLKCRNRFLSTPLDKAREANQRAVVLLINEWPQRLKRRNEITAQLNKFVEEYVTKKTKDIAALGKDTTELRRILREAEGIGRPRVKPKVFADAKALLMRAEH